MQKKEPRFIHSVAPISGFTIDMTIEGKDTLVYVPLTPIEYRSSTAFTGSVSQMMLANKENLYNLYDAKIIDDSDFDVGMNSFQGMNEEIFAKQKPYMLTRIDYEIGSDHIIQFKGFKEKPVDISKYEKSLIAMIKYVEFLEMNAQNYYLRDGDREYAENCHKIEVFQAFCNLMNLEQHVIQTYKNTNSGN